MVRLKFESPCEVVFSRTWTNPPFHEKTFVLIRSRGSTQSEGPAFTNPYISEMAEYQTAFLLLHEFVGRTILRWDSPSVYHA
jgi:hypothetical protein